jgi:hypothetical protein
MEGRTGDDGAAWLARHRQRSAGPDLRHRIAAAPRAAARAGRSAVRVADRPGDIRCRDIRDRSARLPRRRSCGRRCCHRVVCHQPGRARRIDAGDERRAGNRGLACVLVVHLPAAIARCRPGRGGSRPDPSEHRARGSAARALRAVLLQPGGRRARRIEAARPRALCATGRGVRHGRRVSAMALLRFAAQFRLWRGHRDLCPRQCHSERASLRRLAG